MPDNLLALAVPLFLIAIVIEIWIGRRTHRRLYHFGTSLSDLGCGIASTVAEVFLKGLGLWVYVAVYDGLRVSSLSPSSVGTWVVALVGVDLLYYLWHRASHVIGVLWAVHGVHHQSEDFNFAVALRQPAFESLSAFAFYLPLALLGVPLEVYLTAYALNLFYQFWIHTELVGRSGPLGWVFNTASHHRVHHGINPQYLDRNYGGVLIVWDRLFGTFEPEVDPVVYGVTKPLRSLNPLWANLEQFAVMGHRAARYPRWRDKIRAFVGHPGWTPEGPVVAREVSRQTFEKYEVRPDRTLRRYVTVHLWLSFATVGAFMAFEGRLTLGALAGPAVAIAATMAALAGLAEGKRWAPAVDILRQVATVAALGVLAATVTNPWGPGIAAVALAAIYGLLQLRYRPRLTPAAR